MTILKVRNCLLLAAIAFLGGCGKQERSEAVQFAKVLKETKSTFVSADTTERDLISSARAWCGGITANGGGRGVELDQNAAVAAELAKSASGISSQFSQVRQAIDGPVLTEDYPRSVRSELISQLTRRQRQLQEMRALLQQAGPQFLEFRQSRAYVGDTYPDGVGKLDALLRAYQAPDDALGAALANLQAKYDFQANEL